MRAGAEMRSTHDQNGRALGPRALQTRQRLLAATAELLAEQSVRDVSVVEIARNAGTSPAAFYQYFKDVGEATLRLAEQAAEDMPAVLELIDRPWNGDGGLGNVFSLFASGLVTRVDHRAMLAFGCLLNAISLYMMTSLTLGMDYWSLALPRFLQGFASAFSWTGSLAWLVASAPARSRGRLIGSAFGVAIAGALFGPVLGLGDYSRMQRDAYDTIDARLAFGGERWTVALIGKNITDEKWLQEVIRNEEVLGHLRETLGLQDAEASSEN